MFIRGLFCLFIITLILKADFKEGEKIFIQKCASCHTSHIPVPLIKENFFEKDNKILNLKIPSVNMLSYAIIDGPKKIGDSEDIEMRQIEIEEYLKGYLSNPDKFYSICDEHILKYYIDKKPMKISDDEAVELAIYFMEYKQNYEKLHPETKVLNDNFNEFDLVKKANLENKQIIIYANSKTCHFCKKMKKEVLEKPNIQKLINDNYIFVSVDVDETILPFNLDEVYKKITPTFFFLTKDGKLKKQYFGAWKEKDFIDIIKEQQK